MDEEGRGFEPRRGLIQDFVFLLCQRIEWKDRMEGSNDLRSAVLRTKGVVRINLFRVAPSTIIAVNIYINEMII